MLFLHLYFTMLSQNDWCLQSCKMSFIRAKLSRRGRSTGNTSSYLKTLFVCREVFQLEKKISSSFPALSEKLHWFLHFLCVLIQQHTVYYDSIIGQVDPCSCFPQWRHSCQKASGGKGGLSPERTVTSAVEQNPPPTHSAANSMC